eukprot:jgi/Phyca11/110416/e_gw1.18.649.1
MSRSLGASFHFPDISSELSCMIKSRWESRLLSIPRASLRVKYAFERATSTSARPNFLNHFLNECPSAKENLLRT